MVIKAAYYPPNLPTQMMLVTQDGKHYMTNLNPCRKIEESDLHFVRSYDVIEPERFWNMTDRVPDYVLRFYGLEKFPVVQQLCTENNEYDQQNNSCQQLNSQKKVR